MNLESPRDIREQIRQWMREVRALSDRGHTIDEIEVMLGDRWQAALAALEKFGKALREANIQNCTPQGVKL